MNNNETKPRDDQPQGKNPDEIGKSETAKQVTAHRKIDIKESEVGREQSQQPIVENIDENVSQIDKGTIELLQQQSTAPDNRDNNDGTTDWNAENNESGRRK